jgi:hypothetical protein
MREVFASLCHGEAEVTLLQQFASKQAENSLNGILLCIKQDVFERKSPYKKAHSTQRQGKAITRRGGGEDQSHLPKRLLLCSRSVH